MSSPWRSPQRMVGAASSPSKKAMASSVSLPSIQQMMTFSENFPGLRKTQQIQTGVKDKLPVLAQILGKPPGPRPAPKGPSANELLTVYVRARNTVSDLHSSGRRVPGHVSSELQSLEDQLCSVLPPLNPRFFQRLDRAQLCKALRSMSVQRLSLGKWIFGGEAASNENVAAFLLISGTARLFQDDPAGPSEQEDIEAGVIFGPRKPRHHDQSPKKRPTCDKRGIAARAESNVTVGILSIEVISSAMGGADNNIANSRVEQVLASLKLFQDLDGILRKHMKELAVRAQTLMVQPGAKLLAQESAESQFLVVTKGTLYVKGDIYVEEAPKAAGPQGRRKMEVYIEHGKGLAGDSMFDKLDPYCVCKLSDVKRFQTPVMHNAGTEPIWKKTGHFLYDGEDGVTFEVYDYDRFSSDDFCGSGFLPFRDFEKGFEGEVKLTLKKRTAAGALKGLVRKKGAPEDSNAYKFLPAGTVWVSISWVEAQRSAAEIAAAQLPKKHKTFRNQLLFERHERQCWGHEAIFLEDEFMHTLERAAVGSEWKMRIANLTLEASPSAGAFHVMRFPRRELLEFVRKFGQKNAMTQYCRVATVTQQNHIRTMLYELIEKWRVEESKKQVMMEADDVGIDITKDIGRFRSAFRGAQLRVTINCGINLEGGGWLDKLDPYAVARLKGGGSGQIVKTPALQDVGANPVWEHTGTLTYGGEDILEFQVFDEDQFSSDDLIAIGELKVAQFTDGYEGMVELRDAKKKKKKNGKPPKSAGMIIVSIEWSLSEEFKNNMEPGMLR
eukprot:gnl/MRDRNA2_/MRDRNA2_95798_c0_seq1.p1 gnl/MRDRNA2_/MRDRNA2_95798_c0~~gnl/MRDRNA2_/MRDRNA2_95798_c0_seq1.p1  ORF type:complete len:782 (+),score=172.08 gnl/MRDRNA2_/MRDRNA2_95798_c0_seq1:132-2477(+)